MMIGGFSGEKRRLPTREERFAHIIQCFRNNPSYFAGINAQKEIDHLEQEGVEPPRAQVAFIRPSLYEAVGEQASWALRPNTLERLQTSIALQRAQAAESQPPAN